MMMSLQLIESNPIVALFVNQMTFLYLTSTREYPQHDLHHVLYTGRTMLFNLIRKYHVLTPHHDIFGFDQAEARGVPEDAANFHLSRTRE